MGCDCYTLFFCHSGRHNFYSHIPCGMWPHYSNTLTVPWDFYSHIPCGMWLRLRFCSSLRICYFYSHIPCGMWRITKAILPRYRNFYSHIPCGMWLYHAQLNTHHFLFLLTHPVWDVTHITPSNHLQHIISTHTSRVGCDPYYLLHYHNIIHFYSHIPCGMWHHGN